MKVFVISILLVFSMLFLYIACIKERGSETIKTNKDNSVVSSISPAQHDDKTEEGVSMELSDQQFEQIFKAIDNFSKISKNKTLRSSQISENDKEIRFWIGFGLGEIRNLTLKYKGGIWYGSFLSIDPSNSKITNRLSNIAPKLGWEKVVNSSNFESFLQIIQSSEKDIIFIDPDIESIIIESKFGDVYRVRVFTNQVQPNTIQGKKVVTFCKEIAEEFNLKMGCDE